MSDPDNYVPNQPDESHFLISQRAAESLGRLVDGNGLKADQVRLARHETLVHQVPGYIHLELKPDIVSGQRKGNVPVGKVLGGKEAIHAEAAGLVRDFVQDKNIQEQIMMEVRKDKGRGFGMEPFKVPLNATSREFSVVEKCLKCNGNCYSPCTHCTARGTVACGGCAGQGAAQCAACYGSGQYQRGDGQRAPCVRCNGQGRMQCTTCNGQRFVRCNSCAGLGRVDCTECARSGYWTNVFQLSFHAEGRFDLDRLQVPPDVLNIIDMIGVRKVAVDGYAQIFRSGVDAKDKFITLPMVAFLPIAQAEFTIEGKPYPATVAGLPGRIVAIPPILDTSIKPGINALYKLSKGPMAAQALIEQACRYRLIRQVLAGLAHSPKKVVYQQVAKEYPFALSEKYAKATIKYADAAVLAIGKGPRLKGLLVGTVAAAAFYAAYYPGPLRVLALTPLLKMGQARLMLGLDLIVWAIGYAIAVMAIKLVASGALKKLLPDSVKTKDRGLPAAGQEGPYALGTTFVPWLVLAFCAVSRPEWLLYLLKLAKLG